jgi:MOSC domain-containing protein YiiM
MSTLAPRMSGPDGRTEGTNGAPRRSADNAPMTMAVASVNVPRPAGSAVRLRLAPATGPVAVDLAGFATRAEGHPVGEDPALADEVTLSHALYAYCSAHLPVWRTMRAQAGVSEPDAPIPPGAFDEHLMLDGVQESQLWEGDLLRFPDCTLVVSVPRLPDARFNETLGFVHAARMVAQSRWSGFWLSVRVPGTIAAGQAFELIPGPRDTGVVELFRARTAKMTW